MTNHVKVAADFHVILPDVIPDIELSSNKNASHTSERRFLLGI